MVTHKKLLEDGAVLSSRLEKFAGLVLLLGVVCASSASILFRLAAAPPAVAAFYRLAYAAAIHGIISASDLRAYRDFDMPTLRGALLAGLALAIHFLLWFTSLDFTSVAASTVLVSLHPVFTAALAYLFLREILSLPQILCALLALAGTGVIAVGDAGQPGTLLGDVLALGGAAAMATYLLIGRRVRATVETMPYTTVVYASSAICVLAFLVSSGTSLGGYGVREHILFLSLAILPTLFGHTLFNWSLRHIQTFNVSASVLGEPVGATILAYFVLHELPGVHQLIGGALILLGLGFLTRYRHRRGVAPAEDQ